MRSIITNACRLTVYTTLLATGFVLADERPNIIVIFTDDQGYSDLGCQHVREDIRTPHIDGLAERGIRMTSGFVTAPQCMPSRVGILTGRFQQHSGVETNRTATQPAKVAAMAPNVATIATHLKKAGYTTGMSGKWGIGGGPSRNELRGKLSLAKRDALLLPAARGFDEYFSGVSQVYVASHQLNGMPIPDAPQLVRDARYRVEVQTEAALDFVRRHAKDEKPFFLYYAPYSPHAPFEAPQSYLDQFEHIEDRSRRICLAMMACVDDSVGRLIEALRQNEIEDNTLIWFISDNGAPTNGGGLNLPLGGAKGSLLDGGIRVPFIVSWTGHLAAGTEYHEMVSTLDVLPTCLSVANANDLPEQLDGVNLLPFLRGEQDGAPHEHLYFRWTFQGKEQAAIRSAKWKLLRSGVQERLFDLSGDPGETQDVAATNPQVSNIFRQRLEKWLTSLPAAANPPRKTPRARRK